MFSLPVLYVIIDKECIEYGQIGYLVNTQNVLIEKVVISLVHGESSGEISHYNN